MWTPNGASRKFGPFIYSSLLLVTVLVKCHDESRRSTKTYRHAATNNNNNEPIGQAGGAQSRTTDSRIYLESLDDLEHVAYLAMRNFNITDESLIQSSWNSGGASISISSSSSNNMMAHKQLYKKVVASSSPVSAGAENHIKDRLALMLESFILHLRNGHLRQLKLEELKEIVAAQQQQQLGNSYNITTETTTAFMNAEPEPASANDATQSVNYGSGTNSTLGTPLLSKLGETKNVPRIGDETSKSDADSGFESDESHERCNCLVSLYVQEIKERHKAASFNQQQKTVDVNNLSASSQQQESGSETLVMMVPFDQVRLIKLCRLVVRCHSADELVVLLNGPWYDKYDNGQLDSHKGGDDVGSAVNSAEPTYDNYPSSTDGFPGQQRAHKNQPRSLRDSLSQSLAKLCPLMLFQLHDEDGLCSFRRDDRPPMITVWAFATLFVTIVSFVSLIGLSITPLLGPSASGTNQTITSSSSSELSAAGLMQPQRQTTAASGQQVSGRVATNNSHHQNHHHPHPRHHRACLTLFEGLAVGSLVGSALFSLIPQAFELQERESNQGFLLKALIIFFGIYLFFCSERIMRIILDTRQFRKRKRRSSNSMAPPSTTVDNLVRFPPSTTGCSAFQQQQQQQQHQLKHHSRQRSSLNRDYLHSVAPLQDQMPSSARPLCEPNRKSTRRPRCQPLEIETSCDKQAANLKGVNFPAGKLVVEPSNAMRDGRHRMRRRERSINLAASAGMDAAGKSRNERRQAAKRHQSRTRRSTTAAGRRQKRKTRYQLLVQSKRLHNDSLTVPRGTDCVGEQLDKVLIRSMSEAKDDEPERLPLRRRGSLSSSDDAASYNLDSSIHNSGTSEQESYDSTTSLDSSSSSGDSDDSVYGLGTSQRSRQQHLKASGTGQQKYLAPASRAASVATPRRPASFHFHQSGTALESNNLYIQSPGQANISGETLKRPSSASEQATTEKQEISTVAWMIVLGDGLHNFIDGISIGAAFSESILSGVSISVAVICEEFPHELGDFAVLVSSGMTVRQALGYNFLSACTCYLGMAVGIILGDVNDSASYISALAAGVFLYIALVDMMGELSASLEESSRDSIGKTLKMLLLQNVGIFIGISIILVLSFIDF